MGDHGHRARAGRFAPPVDPHQCRYAEAAPLYDKSLSLLERLLGDDHPRVAVVLHNYGDLLREQGELEQAAAFYHRSRHILEERLGADHPNVSTSLIGSAKLLAVTGRLEDAAAELERAITIREAAFGAVSPRLREPLTEYAGVLRRLGRGADAAAVDARLDEVDPRPEVDARREVSEPAADEPPPSSRFTPDTGAGRAGELIRAAIL